MAYKVILEEAFERDYIRAIDYLVENLNSPKAAKQLIANMRNAASVLQATPCIRAVSRKRVLSERGMREYFVGGYTIIYRVDEETHQVKLYRLFHQLQQYDDEWYWSE